MRWKGRGGKGGKKGARGKGKEETQIMEKEGRGGIEVRWKGRRKRKRGQKGVTVKRKESKEEAQEHSPGT